MMSFPVARRLMVDCQIRTSDVTDGRILAAFEAVPRERFVPPGQEGLAYLDRDIPLGNGRTILKPMVFAKLLQAAAIEPTERVLDIGCAAGYSTAVLAHLAHEVVAVEADAALAAQARALFQTAGGFDRGGAKVTLREGALDEGAGGDGSFDVILLNGAVERLPPSLARQLKPGGRLLCVERSGPVSKGMLYLCERGELSGRSLFDAWAPVLPGFAAPAEFVF